MFPATLSYRSTYISLYLVLPTSTTLLCAMSSVKARKYVLRSQFSGPAKREDLELVEEELPPLKDGGTYRHKGACTIMREGSKTPLHPNLFRPARHVGCDACPKPRESKVARKFALVASTGPGNKASHTPSYV